MWRATGISRLLGGGYGLARSCSGSGSLYLRRCSNESGIRSGLRLRAGSAAANHVYCWTVYDLAPMKKQSPMEDEQGCPPAWRHLEPIHWLGWHGLRRRFATDPKQIPLRDLCDLGGWKDPDTVVKCYQTADEEDLRKAIQARRTGQANA